MGLELMGRRILITGASSGIGAATARACADAGARVGLFARRQDRVEALAKELDEVAVPLAADVRSERDVREAVERASRSMGGLDGLVNAAGLNRAGKLATGATDDWREMVETNLLGAILITYATLEHLRRNASADIVNVTSMSAKRVMSPESAIYAGTKAGLEAWSHALAQELGPQGVRVMVMSPGMVDSEFANATRDPVLQAAKAADISGIGLHVDVVADQIVHMLAQPAHVRIREMALMPTAQRS